MKGGEEGTVSWPDEQILELISSGILGQQKLAASGNNYRRCNLFPHNVQIVGSLEKRGSDTSLGLEEDLGQWIALHKPDKLEKMPTTYSSIKKPITKGINKNPIKKVTDPQRIIASDAPRRNATNPAGDTWARLVARDPGAGTPASGVAGERGRAARRRAQSS